VFKFAELNSAPSYTAVSHVTDSDGVTSDAHQCNREQILGHCV